MYSSIFDGTWIIYAVPVESFFQICSTSWRISLKRNMKFKMKPFFQSCLFTTSISWHTKRVKNKMTSSFIAQSATFFVLWLDDLNRTACWDDARNNIRVNWNGTGHVIRTDQWGLNDPKTHRSRGNACLWQRDGGCPHAWHHGNGRSFLIFDFLYLYFSIFLCFLCCRGRIDVCLRRNVLWSRIFWFSKRRFHKFVSEPLTINLHVRKKKHKVFT